MIGLTVTATDIRGQEITGMVLDKVMIMAPIPVSTYGPGNALADIGSRQSVPLVLHAYLVRDAAGKIYTVNPQAVTAVEVPETLLMSGSEQESGHQYFGPNE